MVWHNDRHQLTLRIVKSELEVIDVLCPNAEEDECIDEQYGCVVKWFVNRFGMECNAGSCPAESEMTICWTMQGNTRDIESSQLWFMPINDDVFSAWLTTQKNEEQADVVSFHLDE
jgi:hypothetical protein